MTTFPARTAPSGSTSSAPAASAGRLSMGRRTLGVGLAATVLAAGAYAYTNSNTVPISHAGDGVGEISGYNVTNIQYTLGTDDPSVIDKVAFTLNAPATTVRASIDDGATYVPCTTTTTDTDTDTECDFPVDPAVIDATSLTVVAAS